MKPEGARLEFLKSDSVQGFTAYCGLSPVSIERGRFVARVAIEKHHLQQDGYVHAGVIATLADHTAGYASYTLVPEDRRILTVEYKINFLAPAAGSYLECRAEVIKSGRHLIIAESSVYAGGDGHERESLVAKALLTMAAVPREKVRSRGGRR